MITNVDGLKKAEISVEPDYLSESTSVDMCFIFSLRVWHVFNILFGTIGKAIKKFFETNPDKNNIDANMPTQPTQRRRKNKRRPAHSKETLKTNKS